MLATTMVKAQANQSSKVALLEPPLERRYNCAKKLECLQTGAAAYDANPITARERVEKENRKNNYSRCKEDLGHSHGIPKISNDAG